MKPLETTAALRLVASARRREILRLVWTRERSATEIRNAFPDVTFGAVSQHLRVLEVAGAVRCRKDGRRRVYLARRDSLSELASALESMWDSSLYRLKAAAEMEQARRGPKPRRKTKTERRSKA